jgi:hypothetical protein
MRYKIRSEITFLVFTLLSLFFVISCTSKTKNTPPNIIVFLVDDMGLMDTSVPFLTDTSGTLKKYPLNNYYITPNMEKLAKQLLNFYYIASRNDPKSSLQHEKPTAHT